MILNPQHLKIFGNNISIGDYATLITAPDKRIDLSTWETDKINGELQLGKYILISPGTSIRSAQKIVIGDSTMIASDVTITDSDWHDIYDRTDYVASPKEVIIQENVWIGEKSLILKGSKIGKNSIIGAGSVVSGEVPANVIFAGNPAKQIKKLNEKSFKTRESLFSESSTYLEDLLTIEKKTLEHNSLINWLKSLIWPGK
jgi:acetyltransferase-like isoleucine patch superfamily enzyme